MTIRQVRGAIGLGLGLVCLLTALPGVAQTASPAPAAADSPAAGATPRDTLLERVQFTPPLGWNAVPLSLHVADAHLAGLWRAPAPPQPDAQMQTVNLVIEAYGGTIDEYISANERNLKAAEPGIVLAEPKQELLCGSTPAYLEQESVGLTDGHRLRVEQTFIVTGGHGYVATYTYDASEDPRPEAQTSLDSLCVRPGVVAASSRP